jgi:hypothetical protein
MPLRLFQKHRDVLLRGWQMHSDGRLYHRVLTERVQEMADKRAKDAARMVKHRAAKAESVEKVTLERVSHTEVTRDSRVSSPEVRHPPPTTQEEPKTIGAPRPNVRPAS